jgi:hypothetical protein
MQGNSSGQAVVAYQLSCCGRSSISSVGRSSSVTGRAPAAASELKVDPKADPRVARDIVISWSERRDLNSGPLAPHASALPDCATLRHHLLLSRLITAPVPRCRCRIIPALARLGDRYRAGAHGSAAPIIFIPGAPAPVVCAQRRPPHSGGTQPRMDHPRRNRNRLRYRRCRHALSRPDGNGRRRID